MHNYRLQKLLFVFPFFYSMTLNLNVFGNAYELAFFVPKEQGFDSATLWFAWLLPKQMYIKFIKAVSILSM